MTHKDILHTSSHRPWKCPDSHWRYYQEWNEALFLHWEVEEHVLREFVPKELEIDLFEGKAWVSVVVFKMQRIRPRILPAFPPISNFDEINIRTYVKEGERTGVYFLSIEGSKWLSCALAKAISGLPYRFSKMERTENSFFSTNSEFDDLLKLNFEVGETVNNKGPLDLWLTERYALFQDISRSVKAFEIHHLPWPINEIKLTELEMRYDRFGGLLNEEPHKVHYSSGVRVLAWGAE